MAGTKNALRTARIAVVVLSLLLAVGAVGSWVLASKTIAQNRAEITASASTVTDNTIANVITGQDLAVPVTTARANEIDDALQTSGFGSTGFQNVTIWRTDGQVVYANQQKLLGARLPTEVAHLRSVVKDGASSQIKDGVFQVYVPYITNGTDAVVELDRPDAPIEATATPLRVASGMLGLLFLAALYVLVRLSHAISSAAANQAFRPTQTQGLGQVSQAPDADAPTRGRRSEQAAAQAAYREEAEARRHAEDRARALEEQVSLLQEQYRNSLTELQTTQKKLQESITNAAGPRGDKAAEERLLKAEGRARLLEGQLTAMSQERDKIATQLNEAREDVTRAAAPDPETEHRLQQLQQESIALRAELEGTKTELDVAKRELATNQTRAKDLEAEISGLRTIESDAEQQRDELHTLRQVAIEAEQLRGELEGLRGGAEEADVLRGQLDELRGQLEQLLPHAEAARTLRGELDDVTAARAVAEETAATTQQQLDAVAAELEALRAEAEAASARHDDVAADLERVRGELETTTGDLAAEREGADALRAELEAARAAADAAEETSAQERERLTAEHAAELAAKDAELAERVEAARAELQAELDAIETDLRAKLDATSSELAEDLRRTQDELAASLARGDEAASELERLAAEIDRSAAELEEARALAASSEERSQAQAEELGIVRGELQAATELVDRHEATAGTTAAELEELRTQLHAAVDELEALRTAKSGDENALAHAQADAQGARRELDAALAKLEETERDLETVRAELDATASVSGEELVAARDRIAATEAERDAALAELGSIRSRVDGAEDEATAWRTRLAELEAELDASRAEVETARAELGEAHAEIQAELARGVEVAGRAEQVEQELAMLRDQQIAASAADAPAELEEIARVAQERLASQTDKLTETEDRAHAAEQQLDEALGRLAELEEALRQAAEGAPIAASVAESVEPLEDRRASTPFTKELSLDAKKTLTQILGITLTLKHKKSAQEQAPFLRQLSAMAKRLDRTVSDLAEADKLAHGEIELNVRRTNLEALVERVVEESGVGGEHEVRLETEELVVGVDPLRAEQILNGLLRSSADRTSPGSQITVRLQHEEDGALLSVEDKEASSDGALSPVVARLADVMGGWAKVESRPSGGSAFRVYLPDQSGGGVKTTPKPEDTLQITVENPVGEAVPAEAVDFSEAGDDDPWAAGQLLVQELQRLSHQEGK